MTKEVWVLENDEPSPVGAFVSRDHAELERQEDEQLVRYVPEPQPVKLDPQMHYIEERRALLDAHRLVLGHLVGLITHRAGWGGDNSALEGHKRYLERQIEELSEAE